MNEINERNFTGLKPWLAEGNYNATYLSHLALLISQDRRLEMQGIGWLAFVNIDQFKLASS